MAKQQQSCIQVQNSVRFVEVKDNARIGIGPRDASFSGMVVNTCSSDTAPYGQQLAASQVGTDAFA